MDNTIINNNLLYIITYMKNAIFSKPKYDTVIHIQ